MPRIEIEKERCKGCALCVDVCAEKCIEIGEEFNDAGWQIAVFRYPDKCKACMMCAETCPDVAIEIYK